MATYYWVGSSGNWSDAANHWSNSSGGSPSASYLPTATDDVVFDANSNTGTGAFTVTVDGTSASPSLCQDFSTGGAGGVLDGAMTLAFGTTGVLNIYGSMTLPASNLSISATSGTINYKATSTGKTITTNGVSLTNIVSTIDGVGGGWTLGSAYTQTAFGITITNGAFDSGNYAITVNSLSLGGGSATRSCTLGSSSVILAGTTPINFGTTTGFTFAAGTSTITCSAVSPTFTGGGLTFYNVTFSSAANGTATISGANTFNNLTFTSRSATGVRQIIFAANQTVSATLTFGTANTAIRRMSVYGTASAGTGVGTPVTLTVATLATLADVDFRDITAAGASGTWSGTRIGNGGGNSNITFTAGGSKYWNLAAGGNWSATAWATSSGGAVDVNNFPLAQDTVYIVDTGLTAGNTITIDANWWLPTIDASARTTAFTLASGTQTPSFFGNYTIPSVATVTGTGTWYFGAINSTQNITTNGVSVAFALNCNGSTNNTVKLLDNFTTTGAVTLQQGTLDLNSKTLTGLTFTSNNTISRTVAFGTGKIVITGTTGTVLSMSTVTNFTYTGTSKIEITASGAGRTIIPPATSAVESNAISIYVTTGTDTLTVGGAARFLNFDLTGFTGTLTYASTSRYFGNLVFSSGMTLGSALGFTFAKTSGTQTITSAGNTIDNSVTIDAPGAIVQCQDALTLGSTRTLTMTNGTLQLKAGVTSTVGGFATSGTNQKYLQSTLAGTQATLSCASGTISVSYLTIQDINATGGATWNAFYQQGNIDAGDNTGWYFGETPIIGAEVTMRLRSFTEPRRF